MDISTRLEGGRRSREGVGAECPLVSIVIVLFRDREECIRLLENISAFDRREFELIVIDGGSQDGTLEVLREWNDKIDYWVSEPDSGIYDAMNKGIAAARGHYILHLNAGHTLKCMPTEVLVDCLEKGVDIAEFCVATDKYGIFRPQSGAMVRIINPWHHQGTFYRRIPELVYDTRYRVYADFDLNQRLFKAGKKVHLSMEIVSHHSQDGISQSGLGNGENYRSVRENFGMPYVGLRFLWHWYQALRRATKRVLVYLLGLAGKDWKDIDA